MKTLAVIPVLNEEDILERKVLELHSKMKEARFALDIVISDNNSTDRSSQIAKALAGEYDNIIYKKVILPGKGNAVRHAWLDPDFDSYDAFCFMDTDMATDPEALPRLVNEIEAGSDIVVGSRYLPQSDYRRTPKRLIFSRSYIAIANALLGLGLADFQCGFKGINRQVRNNVVPQWKSERFFFDTEMLYIAGKMGYSIKEIPVAWRENEASSSVHYRKEIPAFLWGIASLRYRNFRYGFKKAK